MDRFVIATIIALGTMFIGTIIGILKYYLKTTHFKCETTIGKFTHGGVKKTKSLTIEKLKALKIGDWVWVETDDYKAYLKKACQSDKEFFVTNMALAGLYYLSYNTKWLAYKNKEQAEAKGEIVELPCLIDYEGTRQLVYRNKNGFIKTRYYYEDEFEEAECRFAELKGESNEG